MPTILRVVASIALLAVALMCGEIAYTVHTVRPRLAVTIDNIDRATIAVGAAAGDIEQGARTWKTLSQSQAHQVTIALSELTASAGALSIFISSLDTSLNKEIAPATAQYLSQQNQLLTQNQQELTATLTSLHATADAAHSLVVNTEADLPAVSKSIDNVATTTAAASATMQDVQKGVHYEVQQLMAPVSKLKAIALFTARLAGRFLGI